MIYIKVIKRFFFLIIYSMYDLIRYQLYSSSVFKGKNKNSDFRIIKYYHRLEKGLSFRSRKNDSGKGAVLELIDIYSETVDSKQKRIALNVLHEYMEDATYSKEAMEKIESFLLKNKPTIKEGGVLNSSAEMRNKGILKNPEDFFLSRYSVRQFSNKEVDESLLARALSLASKTPSVCNRQGWFVYRVNKKQIAGALKFQNGNSGFSDEIKNLIVIAVDTAAFEGEAERYQAWIDGGMYAMSLVYAMHSLGISTCILNLSNSPVKDIGLKKYLSISNQMNLICMVAYGHSDEEIKVCSSVRDEFSKHLN